MYGKFDSYLGNFDTHLGNLTDMWEIWQLYGEIDGHVGTKIVGKWEMNQAQISVLVNGKFRRRDSKSGKPRF